jgi:hypothetical protein
VRGVIREDVVKRALSAFMLLLAIGCADSPTSPTPVQTQPPPTQPGPTVLQLNWNVTAASCAPVTMPPAQPAFADATIVQSGSAVTASWPYQSRTLYANFVLENNVWALCSWDIADL